MLLLIVLLLCVMRCCCLCFDMLCASMLCVWLLCVDVCCVLNVVVAYADVLIRVAICLLLRYPCCLCLMIGVR